LFAAIKVRPGRPGPGNSHARRRSPRFDVGPAPGGLQPNEFLNQGWSRKDASTHSPNILAVSQRFNRTVQWVAASILDKKTVKSRARRMTKIIEIASVRARVLAGAAPGSGGREAVANKATLRLRLFVRVVPVRDEELFDAHGRHCGPQQRRHHAAQVHARRGQQPLDQGAPCPAG